MKSLYPTILFSLLCLAASAQSVVLSDPNKTYPIFNNSAALETEPRQKITVDSLLNHPERYRFVPISQKPIKPNSKKSYWFKVDLTTPTSDNYFLRFFFVGDMLVRVYEVDKNRITSIRQVDNYGASSPDLFQRSRAINVSFGCISLITSFLNE